MAKKITIRGIIGLSDKATPEFLERELAGADDVVIKFASPGGLVMPGIEMGNMIRRHPGKTTAVMIGLAASMSAHIPMKADLVLAEDDAIFMTHNVFGGMMGGDFRDASKLSVRLKAMRDMLAMAFVSKTGKSLDEMQALMDEESFFFGEEIVNEGFADSLVPASAKDEGRNKESAIVLAHSEIESCISEMNKNEAKVKEDFEQATAYFNKLTKEVPKPPAAAGKPKEEAARMKSLKELLAENPNAQTEHDNLVAGARAEGETAGTEAGKKEGIEAGRDEMKSVYAVALPILSSPHYPEAMKKRVGEKAQDGNLDGVKDYVSMYDSTTEGAATAAAIKEQGEETPAAGPTTEGDKVESDFQARLAAKEGV